MERALSPTLAGDNLQRHLLAQAVADAFRLFVLVCHFNHLLLQFHQPTIRAQVVSDWLCLLSCVPHPKHHYP